MANRRKNQTRRKPDASKVEGAQGKGNNSKEKVSSANSMNDVAWYTRYPALTAASASIPYPFRPGMHLPLSRVTSYENEYTIPGVMRLTWTPSIGVSQTATDPASLVAREIYTRVRSAFSSSLDADAPDFLVYLVCLDGIFSYIGTLKRIYRVISAYNPDNYNTPDVLLAALGVTSAVHRRQLERGKVRLWQYINELVYMSRKFRCPGEYDIFNRHYWLNDHIYTDAPSVNSQLYVFWQRGYYKYEPMNTPSGVLAAGATLAYPNYDVEADDIVDELFSFGRGLIDALSDWDDAYTINGYLERAFQDSRYFSVDEIEQNATLDLSYEPEVLTQIENFRGISELTDRREIKGLDISQDPRDNSVIYQPSILLSNDNNWVTTGIDLRNTILSVRQDQPTLVDTIVASRMACAFGDHTGTPPEGFTQREIICGTEIPRAMEIFRFSSTEEDRYVKQIIYQEVLESNSLTGIMNVAAFDWHPQVFAWSGSASNYTTKAVPIFDVHNITSVPVQQLRDIHRVCVLSEWNAFQT